MTCLFAAAADCFSLTSCDGELDVLCRKGTVLGGVGCVGVIVMRTRTCSLAVDVACISLSSCLGELDLVAKLLVVDRGGGVACRDGGRVVTARGMRCGGIDIERPMPFSCLVAVLVVYVLPRGEYEC